MKLHGFLGVSYLISHAFAYHYIVTVPNTYPVGMVNVELVAPTDGNLNCNFSPFRPNPREPFFTTTSCYDPVTSITYPSAGFEIFSKQNTQLSLNNIYYTCSYLGLDSASNINIFRSPDSDDEIVDPASPTTTTATAATTTTSTTSTASPTTSATTTSVSPAQTCTGTSKGKKRGDGYNDAFRLTSTDCINNCVRGKCDGPSPILQLPTNCKKGAQGKKNGSGLTNYCCISSDDCQDTCINGVCGHCIGKEHSTTKRITKKINTNKTTTKKTTTKKTTTAQPPSNTAQSG